ncbi:unnamed protein product [Euphydryas editha]|uniref:Uncharacterized protein n=1 Tax=Euphydryas editha TaxID=104508 RepID=A0AAU9TJW6_EUPED|nr:unnamed protein product [Euphydryas editha]
MESNKFLDMLSARSSSGGNYFHEACQAGSLALFIRAGQWMDQPIPSILTLRNNNGEQCTHILVKNKKIYAREMMNIVLQLGADITARNGSVVSLLCTCVFWKEITSSPNGCAGHQTSIWRLLITPGKLSINLP